MNPTEKQMIDKVYQVIADKTLSFGCAVNYGNDPYIVGACLGDRYQCIDGYTHKIFHPNSIKVIGHPVLTGDVLDWAMKIGIKGQLMDLLLLWIEKRKPIEDQQFDCKEHVYNMVIGWETLQKGKE